MKPFETYQRIEGTPMTDRDKQEVGSQSWNEGKWDTFVAPFLPEDCDGMTLVDMGCNAGLYLKMAEDKGFSRVIGVDSNEGAIKRGREYKEKVGGKYNIWLQKMENSIDGIPVADFTILINSHYYFNVGDWLEYLDKLRYKTVNCIIVTANKRENQCNAASDVKGVIGYFDNGGWSYVGREDTGAKEYEKKERTLWGLHFKSQLERVPIDELDNGNRQQRGFLKEFDDGKQYKETEYYRRFEDYRITKGDWSRAHLNDFFEKRLALYDSVKDRGMINPIVVRQSNKRIVDGNHRHDIMRHLGFKSIIVRWVL